MKAGKLLMLFSSLTIWVCSGSIALSTIIHVPDFSGISGVNSFSFSQSPEKVYFPEFITEPKKKIFKSGHQDAIRKQLIEDTTLVNHLDHGDVIKIFGKPGLVRSEGTSLLLQFTSEDCILDVYFLQKTSRPGLVEYYEIRSITKTQPLHVVFNTTEDDKQASYSECLDSLFNAQDKKDGLSLKEYSKKSG